MYWYGDSVSNDEYDDVSRRELLLQGHQLRYAQVVYRHHVEIHLDSQWTDPDCFTNYWVNFESIIRYSITSKRTEVDEVKETCLLRLCPLNEKDSGTWRSNVQLFFDDRWGNDPDRVEYLSRTLESLSKRFKKNKSLSKQVQENLKIGSYSCLERKFQIMFFRIQLKRRISRKDFNWDSDHSLCKKKDNKDMECTDILLKEGGILL